MADIDERQEEGMTAEEFLEARLAYCERLLSEIRMTTSSWEHFRALIQSQREILEFHKNWPILVETPPEFKARNVDMLNDPMFEIKMRIKWMTNEEYRKRFGEEPPTSPLIQKIVAMYSWHPDYKSEWGEGSVPKTMKSPVIDKSAFESTPRIEDTIHNRMLKDLKEHWGKDPE